MKPCLRSVTQHDRAALESFPCRQFQAPWTDVVEEMVQGHLAGALELGAVEALGLWRGDELVGVIAWKWERERPDVVRAVLLAVRRGYRRNGYALRLKTALIEQARAAGARAIESEVHEGNEAMLRLNRLLGASIERQISDPEYRFCVIAL